MLKEFNIITKEKYQLIDITDKIERIVEEAGIKSGLIFIFVPHSTAGLLSTENESGLKQDWLNIFKKIVSGINFWHDKIDNNADSHILSGLIGQGRTLIVEDNKIIRGTWQQIFLVELDGPKNRRIVVKFIKN